MAARKPSKMIKAYLPKDLHTRLREYVGLVSGANASRIVRRGIARYIAEAEKANHVCRTLDGEVFVKLGGEPFPPRRGEIPAGRPMGGADLDDEQKFLTFRLAEDEAERFYDCLFWRNEYLSHVIRQIVEEAIRAS